jgi:hypothetical protein
MRYRVDEAIVLLAAAKFAYQEAGIHDHAGDNEGEEDNSKEQQYAFAPVQNDPTNVERNGERNQTDAQAKEKDDRPAAARDTHGVTLILTLWVNDFGSDDRSIRRAQRTTEQMSAILFLVGKDANLVSRLRLRPRTRHQ